MSEFRPDRDCDGNGNTNAVRAERADRAVKAYGKGNYRDLDDPCVIQDLICDLMHLCDREEIDSDELINDARSCYQEEA